MFNKIINNLASQISARGIHDHSIPVWIIDYYTTARSCNSNHFRKRLFPIVQMHKYTISSTTIKSVVSKIQFVSIAYLKMDR